MHATWTLIGSSLSKCKSGRLTDAALADGYWMMILHLLIKIFGLLLDVDVTCKRETDPKNVYYFNFQWIWWDPKFRPFHLIATPPTPIDEVGWLLPPKRNRPKVSTHFSLPTRKRPFFSFPLQKKGNTSQKYPKIKGCQYGHLLRKNFQSPLQKISYIGKEVILMMFATWSGLWSSSVENIEKALFD